MSLLASIFDKPLIKINITVRGQNLSCYQDDSFVYVLKVLILNFKALRTRPIHACMIIEC